jgi:hypothetical protein
MYDSRPFIFEGVKVKKLCFFSFLLSNLYAIHDWRLFLAPLKISEGKREDDYKCFGAPQNF